MNVMTQFALWALGLAPAETYYSEAECACLARHAAGRRRLAEIGCWQGVNTRRLRRAMAPDGVLFAIDPYPAGRLGFSAARIIARREVDKETNGTVRWVRMTDLDAARWFAAAGEPPLDFVFSDSLNTFDGFAATWLSWSRHAAPGARYALANSRSSPEKDIESAGSVRYTREVLVKDPRFRVVETVGTLTVLEKS